MKKRNLGTTALATILALSLVGCAGVIIRICILFGWRY